MLLEKVETCLYNNMGRNAHHFLYISQALSVVPKKMKSIVVLERARLEQCLGDVEGAKKFLYDALKENAGEWKVQSNLNLMQQHS